MPGISSPFTLPMDVLAMKAADITHSKKSNFTQDDLGWCGNSCIRKSAGSSQGEQKNAGRTASWKGRHGA